jgi:hypothetical protein
VGLVKDLSFHEKNHLNADNRLAGEEMSFYFGTHYHIHRRPSLEPIKRNMNPVYILRHYFLILILIASFHLHLCLLSGHFSFPVQIPYSFPISHMGATTLTYFILSSLIIILFCCMTSLIFLPPFCSPGPSVCVLSRD